MPFAVCADAAARVQICIEGAGQVEHGEAMYAAGKGDVLLMPAVARACAFRPRNLVVGNRANRPSCIGHVIRRPLDSRCPLWPNDEAQQEQTYSKQNDGRPRQEPVGVGDPHPSKGDRAS